MDFGQFDSREAGNKGAWLHLTHPGTGKLLYDNGEPCEVLVYGIESDIGVRVLNNARGAMKSSGEVESLEAVLAREATEALPLIGGFRNIDRGDKPAKAPDDVVWFFGLQLQIAGDHPTFLQQVKSFSMARDNHLKNG